MLALRCVFCTDLRTDSDFCFIRHYLIGFFKLWCKVFTARYVLIPYIKQITFSLWKVDGTYSVSSIRTKNTGHLRETTETPFQVTFLSLCIFWERYGIFSECSVFYCHVLSRQCSALILHSRPSTSYAMRTQYEGYKFHPHCYN